MSNDETTSAEVGCGCVTCAVVAAAAIILFFALVGLALGLGVEVFQTVTS